MKDICKGIQCGDTRRVVREALDQGWEYDGLNSSGHIVIVWPRSEATVTVPMTPGVASWKTVATQILAASGVEVWRKGNRRASRKAVRPSGFSMEKVIHERVERARIAHRSREGVELTINDETRELRAELDEIATACRKARGRANTSVKAGQFYHRLRHEYATQLTAVRSIWPDYKPTHH